MCFVRIFLTKLPLCFVLHPQRSQTKSLSSFKWIEDMHWWVFMHFSAEMNHPNLFLQIGQLILASWTVCTWLTLNLTLGKASLQNMQTKSSGSDSGRGSTHFSFFFGSFGFFFSPCILSMCESKSANPLLQILQVFLVLWTKLWCKLHSAWNLNVVIEQSLHM